MTPLAPEQVLKQVAEAMPADCRENVIIVGSLAAAVRYFSDDPERALRTKDVDSLLRPNAKAVGAAQRITTQLLAAQWTQQAGKWGRAGTADMSEKDLPLVRLVPPGDRQGADWFLELLGAPDLNSAPLDGPEYARVATAAGHFCLCSFRYLAVAEWEPIPTPYGVRIARPEMMALANLLHHPAIGTQLISGTTDRRSNKDLGRVLALSWLAQHEDARLQTEHFESWGANMAEALREKFPQEAAELAKRAGDGLRGLLDSQADLAQALAIADRSLLASRGIDVEAFKGLGRRFLQVVVEDLERQFA